MAVHINAKVLFLFAWSICSGFGIVFALESWLFELLVIESALAVSMKGIVAWSVGVGFGCIHFYIEKVSAASMTPQPQSDVETLHRYNSKKMVEITELMSSSAWRMEDELLL